MEKESNTNKRLFDFLKKYKNTFEDLEGLERNEISKLIFDFINDVYDFADTYDLKNYSSIFDSNEIFDASGKSTLDLFYLILYVVRNEHGAYDPIFDVINCMKNYKLYSTISIHDAINKIIEIQDNKKYYVVGGLLYCTYHFNAFEYSYKGYWHECDYVRNISDYLMGFDETEEEGSPYRFGNSSIMSEIEKISEEEAINEYGISVIIESLKLF